MKSLPKVSCLLFGLVVASPCYQYPDLEFAGFDGNAIWMEQHTATECFVCLSPYGQANSEPAPVLIAVQKQVEEALVIADKKSNFHVQLGSGRFHNGEQVHYQRGLVTWWDSWEPWLKH